MRWVNLFLSFFLFSCDRDRGNVPYVRTFGFGGQELVSDAVQGPNGSVVVAGTTTSVNGQLEIMVGAFDRDSELLWMKAVGGGQADRAFSSILVDDHAVVVTGYLSPVSGRGGWLGRIDDHGIVQWQQYYMQFPTTELRSVIRFNDRYYCVGRENFAHGYFETILVIANSSGELISKVNYQTEFNLPLEGMSLCALNESTLVLAGTADNIQDLPNGRNIDFIFFGIDPQGTVKWRRQYDFLEKEVLNQILATDDGGVLAIGRRVLDGEFGQGIVIKLNGNGDLEWTYEGSQGVGTEFHRVIQLADKSYMIVGTHNLDIEVRRLSPAGQLIWSATTGEPDLERGRGIVPIGRDRYRIVGAKYRGVDADILFLEIDEDGEFK
jgi:hypothetical protein